MSIMELPYDKADRESILQYALKLKNKSLRKYSVELDNLENLKTIINQYKKAGKGNLGSVLEEFYFQYKPNNLPEPDFPEAKLELKSTPLKKSSKGLVAKERLVLNIIDYKKEFNTSFEESSFYAKNACLLLMFYLHERDKEFIDYPFKIITLWDISKIKEEDLRIIREDWERIVQKIKIGKAHEISEGDTFFLAACMKGATKASSYTEQAIKESPPAVRRAYSLKQRYMNSIIRDSLGEAIEHEPIIKKVSEYRNGETFEDVIIRKFSPHYGKTDSALFEEFNINTIAKDRYYLLAKAILGVRKKKIAEFEKAEVIMKTVRFEKSGALKESMSFAQIKYAEIVNEEWDESYWYSIVTKKFFFVIFQKADGNKTFLRKVLFWNMPHADINKAKEFWEETRDKIMKNDFDSFRKLSDNNIFHVRPKAQNSHDLVLMPSGETKRKLCYWLNSSYIKNVLK